MAEIDYAFLADFAKVEANGTLTSVGASWTYLRVEEFPAQHRMSVAGRVKAHMSEPPVNVRITVTAPRQTFTLAADAALNLGPDTLPYGDGRVGLLFALDMQIPLPSEGLYEFMIELEDGAQRRLAFEAVKADPAIGQ